VSGAGDGLLNARPLLVLSHELPLPAPTRIELVAEAGRRGVSVATFGEQDRLRGVAGAVDARDANAIAVCGHAGMQATVAAVAAGRGLPFACIPSGPDDLLARDINGGCKDPEPALTRFLTGEECDMDIAEVNGIAFVNYVALGLCVGPLAPAAGELANAPFEGRAQVRRTRASGVRRLARDDDRRLTPALLICNNCFDMQGLLLGCRRQIDAGVLGIVISEPGAGECLERCHMSWRHSASSCLELAADGPVLADVDGCQRLLHPPLRFRIMPGALRVRGSMRMRTP